MSGRVLLALAFCLLLVGPARGESPSSTLRIAVPPGLDPSRAHVLVQSNGRGGLDRLSPEHGSQELVLRSTQVMTSAKVFIWYPGCKMIAAELGQEDISAERPFAPRFEALPLVPLTIRMVRSNSQPISSQVVSLWLVSPDRGFFHFANDFYASPDRLEMASGITDGSGMVTLTVPSLLDDPTLTALVAQPLMSVRVSIGGRYDLLPNRIPAQRSYPLPVTVRLVWQGRIRGELRQSFLGRNGISAPLGETAKSGVPICRVCVQAREHTGKTGGGSGVGANGAFRMTLPGGTYDLSIMLLTEDAGFDGSVPLEEDVVVGECADRRLVFE